MRSGVLGVCGVWGADGEAGGSPLIKLPSCMPASAVDCSTLPVGACSLLPSCWLRSTTSREDARWTARFLKVAFACTTLRRWFAEKVFLTFLSSVSRLSFSMMTRSTASYIRRSIWRHEYAAAPTQVDTGSHRHVTQAHTSRHFRAHMHQSSIKITALGRRATTQGPCTRCSHCRRQTQRRTIRRLPAGGNLEQRRRTRRRAAGAQTQCPLADFVPGSVDTPAYSRHRHASPPDW